MTKAFLFGAIIMPVLIMLLFIVVMPLMMESNKSALIGTLAVIAPDDVAAEISTQFEKDTPPGPALPPELAHDPVASAVLAPTASDVDLEIMIVDASELESRQEEVRDGELAALVVIPDEAVEANEDEVGIDIFIPSSFSPNHTNMLRSAATRAVVDVRLRRLGHKPEDIRSLLRRPVLATTRLASDGGASADNEIARRMIPMAFMMLLWIATFTSGNYLLTTTIEEKGNKVMEVLLSAVSPFQLLGGKILGQACVSLVMLLMYGAAGFAALISFAMLDLIPFVHLIYFGLYFVMAYFMIAAIMAAVGSAVTELRDAQSLIGPAMLLLIVPLALWPVLSEHPNGMVATITGFTPPLIPFVMILRVTAATEPVALWQIIVSLVLGYAAVFVMIWGCARIFRIGVLMQGRPPGFGQLLRWIRMG
jgi:ABC-2 type transport system permease protein